MFSARSLQLARRVRAFIRCQLRSPWHTIPLAGAKFPVVDSTQLIGEERLPWYDPNDFYPVRIGEVFQSRYQVVGKLGYGGYSTAWLCRDLIEHCHVAVKVCSRESDPIRRELAAFEYLNNLPRTEHHGQQYIRTSLDKFELTAPSNGSLQTFQCFVFEPMAESVWTFRHDCSDWKLPEWLVKVIIQHVLIALDYLHRHAKVIHADIQEKNILFSVKETDAFEAYKAYEERELSDPVPRKVADDRHIYLTRNIHPPTYGRPLLCDFGEARFGRMTYTGLIQPEQYRAPEVLLAIPWDEKVDIWSVGVMIWNMFLGKNMFRVNGGPEDKVHLRYHLAHMVSLLGPPPPNFLKRSESSRIWDYFDAQGNWIGANSLPEDSLEMSEDRLEGENKAQFLSFIRKMVKWKPEDRYSAQDLIEDPWLRMS